MMCTLHVHMHNIKFVHIFCLLNKSLCNKIFIQTDIVFTLGRVIYTLTSEFRRLYI